MTEQFSGICLRQGDAIHKYVGLKLSHDAGIAVINSKGKLEFAVELEKLNQPRHTKCCTMKNINRLFIAAGLDYVRMGDIHKFRSDKYSTLCIDGWDHPHTIDYKDKINSAPYNKTGEHPAAVDLWHKDLGSYMSTDHFTNHVLASYCTSPFARENKSANVLVWDGSIKPTIVKMNPDTGIDFNTLRELDPKLYGTFYNIMGEYFGPFRLIGSMAFKDIEDQFPYGSDRSVPGKLMGWIHNIKEDKELVRELGKTFLRMWNKVNEDVKFHSPDNPIIIHKFFQKIWQLYKFLPDRIICFALQQWAINQLIISLTITNQKTPLCLAGGCFLNVNWNSAIRNNVVKEVWVPPFVNDSGNAIGAAIAAYIRHEKPEDIHIDWNVYCGPKVDTDLLGVIRKKYQYVPMSPKELGHYMSHSKEPVLVLSGRCEIGPRALGHRSILAAPTHQNRVILNKIKGREYWRPVAACCLFNSLHLDNYEPRPDFFDKYMLFSHKMKREGINKIAHGDDTCRLQIINSVMNPEYDKQHSLRTIITEFSFASPGLSFLLNTSANEKGKGFFNELGRALAWAAEVEIDVWLETDDLGEKGLYFVLNHFKTRPAVNL